MSHQPQQHEIGIHLAVKQRLQIKFQIRLPRQRLTIAQHPQPQPIRHQRPDMIGTAIEKLLHQTVRIALHTAHAPIQTPATADQMNRRRAGLVMNRIQPPVDLRAGMERQHAKSQFPQQRQIPPVVGQGIAGLADR